MKLFVGVFCALLLVTAPVMAADTVVKATNMPVVVQSVAAPSVSPFNSGEFGVSLGSGYALGQAKTVSGGTLFKEAYTLNFNAGAFWFPWRNVGFEANVPFYQTKGVSLSEVQAGVLFRLPLAKTTALFKNIAPYVGFGGVYNWNTEQDLAYVAKVGTEIRLNNKWGLFTEGQYRNKDTSWGQGQVSLNGGIKLVF